MLRIQLKKEIISFLLSWNLFAFSLLQIIKMFVFSFETGSYYISLNILIYALLFIVFCLVCKKRFYLKINFPYFLLLNLIYALSMTFYAYAYHKTVMTSDDFFNYSFYFILFIANTILSSVFFLFTSQKK